MKYLIFLLIYLASVSLVSAYSLPYPSYMPGHKLYTVSRFIDTLKSYWHWGTIAQFKYHRYLADKYFVESKILFEYGQYLLAVDALKRSDEQFMMTSPKVLEQMKAHRDILKRLKQMLPEEFLWQPEKQPPTLLPLHRLLDEAIELRNE